MANEPGVGPSEKPPIDREKFGKELLEVSTDSDDGDMQTRETKLRQQLGLPVGLIERANSVRRRAAPSERITTRKHQGRRT